MKLTVYKTDGSSSGRTAELDDTIFGIEPNETVLYEDVRRILANKRQGTAKTKERSEVRGGGKKAYKQKGTGMARRGSIRSPLLKGGGTVFGPSPRNYTIHLSKKARKLARKSALSLKAAADEIRIVEELTFEAPKTKLVAELLGALGLSGKKVLILTPDTDKNLYMSARNITGVSVTEARNPNTYQIMNADVLLLFEQSVQVLESTFITIPEEEAA